MHVHKPMCQTGYLLQGNSVICFLAGESVIICSFAGRRHESGDISKIFLCVFGVCFHVEINYNLLLTKCYSHFVEKAVVSIPLPHLIDHCFLHYCTHSGNCTFSLAQKGWMLTVRLATYELRTDSIASNCMLRKKGLELGI